MRFSILATVVSLLAIPTQAFAWGEIFQLKINGWENCTDGRATRLNTRTAVPLWVRLDSAEQWSVSQSPGFPDNEFETFQIFIEAVAADHKRNKNAFFGSALFEGGYVVMSGDLHWDTRSQRWKALRGTFNQIGMFDFECWSSGKISTSKRLN